MRRITSGMAVLLPILCAAMSALASGIDDDFKMYYRQRVLDVPYHGPLGFLQEAAAARIEPEQMLKGGASRTIVLDRGNGTCRSRTARIPTRR